MKNFKTKKAMRSSQCPAPVVVLLSAIHCFACAERVTLSEVVGVVARGEIHRLELDVQECDAMLKDAVHGDTQDAEHSFLMQAAVLGVLRFPVLAHLPPHTIWEKHVIGPEELGNLQIIHEKSWSHFGVQCATVLDYSHGDAFWNMTDHYRKVREMAGKSFERTLVAVRAIAGPLTLLEGNHRAIAMYRGRRLDGRRIMIYIGTNAAFSKNLQGSFLCKT